MNKKDYELRLKNLQNKISAINRAIESMKEKYNQASTDETRDLYRTMIIGTEISYTDCKKEYLELIADPNQDN